MSNSTIEETLVSAEALCRASGVNLTTKRKRVLNLLLEAGRPISAYELIDSCKARYAKPLTAMSAYRMLNFLVEQGLAHKLHSVNKYTACMHINCCHDHELPQFLICDHCEDVIEVGLKRDALDSLRQGIETSGFTLKTDQLELRGLCKRCVGQ